jgi:hypothetical protein
MCPVDIFTPFFLRSILMSHHSPVLSSLFSPGHYCLFLDSMSEITSQLHLLLLSCIAELFVHYMYSHLSVLYCSIHISAELWAEIVNVVISPTYCSKHLKTVFSFIKEIHKAKL